MKTLVRIIADNPTDGQDSIKESIGLEVYGIFMEDEDGKPNGKVSAEVPDRGRVILNKDEYEIV